jgi:uncharacterized protein (DUF2267 family)
MNQGLHSPFEATYQTTGAWFNELMEELGWNDRHRTYQVLRAVLHTLRDRLTVAETADLAAQLPMLLRGLYYEGWKPSGKPVKGRKKEEFLADIAAVLQDREVFPEQVAWAVFKILQRHVSAGEIQDIKGILPPEIRGLWPEGTSVAAGGGLAS